MFNVLYFPQNVCWFSKKAYQTKKLSFCEDQNKMIDKKDKLIPVALRKYTLAFCLMLLNTYSSR